MTTVDKGRVDGLPDHVRALLVRREKRDTLTSKMRGLLTEEPKTLDLLIVELWEKHQCHPNSRGSAHRAMEHLMGRGVAKRVHLDTEEGGHVAAFVSVRNKQTKSSRNPTPVGMDMQRIEIGGVDVL